jgi:CubicO group peptidase (beta-lactamase class C family)
MSNEVRRQDFANVRQSIQSQLVETGVPSLAVAVAQNGEIVWETAFGWANREQQVAATPHTLYSLASISKPITATGLMVLVERGLIDLDRPINDYLGNAKLKAWSGDAKDATVRRVANHTSGLPLHYHFFYEDEPYVRPPMDETIRRYGNLVTPPGETYQYANLGYGLLDYVISRVSGIGYADFMRQEVFIPLNMPHASVDVGPGLEEQQAIRYTPDGRSIPFYDFDHPGASAVYCSAHDLVRFGMFHLHAHLPDQKTVLSDTAIEEMQRPTFQSGLGSGYGIGWRVYSDGNGNRIVSHTGGMGGVNTILALLPAQRAAIAALANTQTELHVHALEEILAAFPPEYARIMADRDAEQKRLAEEASRSNYEPLAELLGVWRGKVHTYAGEIAFTLHFQTDGDIHVRLGEGLWTLLNYARFEDNTLTGRTHGDIGTDDAGKRPYHIHVKLRLRGKVLNGAVTAISLPGKRDGNALSHWAELRKA